MRIGLWIGAGLLTLGLIGAACERVVKAGFDAFQFSSVDKKDINVVRCDPPNVC
jgi:hypothetical protein